MKNDLKHSPIFITGTKRSGSSMIAKILEICGVFTGEVSSMKESKVLSSLMDQYFDFNNFDKKAQHPLPPQDIFIPTDWKSKVEEALVKMGYKEQPWMYKDSRLALTWQMWDYAFPNAKWIIVRRKSTDIIKSCLQTSYMNAYEDSKVRAELVPSVTCEEEGWLWWIHEHEKKFVQMIEAGLNCKMIWPERMVEGDYQQIYETLQWLGIEWADDIIKQMEPMLSKSRGKVQTIKR